VADGWAVEVTMQVLGGGEPKRPFFYAHIPDRSAAENAVRERVSATPDVRVEAKAPIPHAAFVGMNVPEGEVIQWM
jgi:hypothetical protein